MVSEQLVILNGCCWESLWGVFFGTPCSISVKGVIATQTWALSFATRDCILELVQRSLYNLWFEHFILPRLGEGGHMAHTMLHSSGPCKCQIYAVVIRQHLNPKSLLHRHTSCARHKYNGQTDINIHWAPDRAIYKSQKNNLLFSRKCKHKHLEHLDFSRNTSSYWVQ